MTERVGMMTVDAIKNIGRHVNNYVPSMCVFGMRVFEDKNERGAIKEDGNVDAWFLCR